MTCILVRAAHMNETTLHVVWDKEHHGYEETQYFVRAQTLICKEPRAVPMAACMFEYVVDRGLRNYSAKFNLVGSFFHILRHQDDLQLVCLSEALKDFVSRM